MGDRIYKFGQFELLASVGELRTGDSCVRLQEKPLQLLIVLVENQQRLVTRAQLRERMWDTETFVDYELGINVAIKKVRDALGDSAENPTFIQTVARKGYRFLVPVEVSSPEPVAPKSLVPNTVTDAPARSARDARHLVSRRWLFAALAVGVLFVLGIWRFESRANPRPSQIHSLAVLPLRNLSADPGQDYLADGITEELITDFAQSLPLRVISRTSVMRYKQTNQSITQIGQELGADAIVEGSVSRSGNHVTVTVQLIDATEDRHLWAQKFDRNLEDLPSLEAQLSQQIASQVGATLSSQRALTATKPRPVDSQVHELCLLGRYHWNKRTAADLKKSAEYYQQAIARDPTYAPAYAGLADAYALMPSYSSVEMQESYAKAAAAAHHALELDDSLAQAHATLGFIGLNDRTGWTQTEPEFRRALDLNPNYATVHHWFAFYLLFLDRPNEALAEMEMARQLDPLSAIINADEGQFLYGLRRYDEAKARLRQAIELAPDLGQPHETLALVYLETGHETDAFDEARAGLALDPGNPRTLGEAGYVLVVTGHNDQARALLAQLKKLVTQGAANPIYTAFIYVGLGQRNQALEALEQQATDACCGLQGMNQWHILDGLRDDPRYQRLLAQLQQMRTSHSTSNRSAR